MGNFYCKRIRDASIYTSKNKLVHYNWNEPFTQMSRTLRPYVMRMRDI